MRKTRKLAAASLAACMSVTLLAGCSNSGGNDAQTDGNDSGGAKEITLMASQNWIKDVDNELFDKFEEETGIKVEVSLTPDNEYATLLGTTLSGGSDAVDMFMYEAGTKMISDGIPEVAVDLSDEPWDENMEDWAIAAKTEDGRHVGFRQGGGGYGGVI